MAKKRKKATALIIIIACLTVILGGGYGTLAIFKAKARLNNHFGTPSEETFDENAEVDERTFVTINKKKGEDFVILNITDTHLSDYDYRLFTGFLARRDIKRLVKKVKPDLITLSGDLVCADSEYNSVYKLTELMNSFQIPWAPVFGNHDGEASNIDKDFLAEVMMGKQGDKNNYCVMRKGPSDLADPENEGDTRVGNYVINIVENDNGAINHYQTLFMMDTGRDQLTDRQIVWYRKNVEKVRKIYGSDAKSTLVVHIPLAEYYYAYMEGYDTSKKEWNAQYKEAGAYGDCFEDVCCNKKKFSSKEELVSSEEFAFIPDKYKTDEYIDYFLGKGKGMPIKEGIFKYLKVNGTETVICGHDHLNCFFAPYEGVNLVYSLKNGMGSGYKVGRNGGTVITLSKDKSVNVSYLYL